MAINATLRPQYLSTAGKTVERTDALVISNDDSFLIELGPLLGDRYRVHSVDTPAGIDGQVDVVRWIGIVDADSQKSGRSAVSRLEVQHPHCPLIVVSARPEDYGSVGRDAVLATISRNQISAANLSEALLAAEDRLRSDRAEKVEATAPSAGPDRFEESLQRRGSVWAGAAVLLVVLAVNGAWLHHWLDSRARGGANGTQTVTDSIDARNPAASSDAASPSPPQRSVLELLSAARVAFRDQKSLPPRTDGEWRGDSALELYAQVLRQDPQNDEALEGVSRLLVVGRNRIMADAASGNLDDATRLLGLLQTSRVGAEDLRPLASAIGAARPRWLAQRAAQNIAAGDFKTADQLLSDATASGADATTLNALRTQETEKKLELQLKAMATQVNSAVQAGALLQPAADNARTRLAAMRSIGRNHPLTLQSQQLVQAALVQSGEQATRAAQFDLAQRDLSAAAELGNSASLSEARRQLQQAKDAAERAAAVAVAAVQRAPEAPAQAPAATASVSTGTSSPSTSYIAAQPTRGLPLRYPAGVTVSGSVTVEFTLSANGLARDVTVVDSDPPRLFDRAAIDAVQRGRYRTEELMNGQPARARIKLRFNMPDN